MQVLFSLAVNFFLDGMMMQDGQVYESQNIMDSLGFLSFLQISLVQSDNNATVLASNNNSPFVD